MFLTPSTKKYLIQSIGIHVFIIMVISLIMWIGEEQKLVKPKIIRTRLLKFGKKRDKHLLPRKVRHKKKKSVQQKSSVKEHKKHKKKNHEIKKSPQKSAEELLAEVIEKKSATDLIEEKTSSLDALTSKLDELEVANDEGSEQGLQEGTALSGHLKASYNDQILLKIEKLMQIPMTISEIDRSKLQTQIFLQLDAKGILLEAKVIKSSGKSAFDNAALLAVKRAQSFGAPPLLHRAFYKKGFRVIICPLKCSR